MAAASVIAVILFLTVNIGSSVLNSNTQLAFNTKKHNSGTADFNGMRSFSSLSKSINYTYEVKSPTSVLNSLNIIAAHRGVTRMKGVDAVLVSNGNSFSLFTRNVTIKSEPNLNPGVLYDLFYYFHSEIIKLEITGGNGYNYTFTNDTGAPIAMFTYPAVDLENATISLLATGHIFRTYLNTPLFQQLIYQ